MDREFAAYVEQRGPALLRFAYLVLGDSARAEEAVQEALARAFPRWPRIAAAEDPDAYVRRMVVNADVSRWRRWGRREVLSPTVAPSGGQPDPMAAVDDADEAWTLLATLPTRQRAAIVLRFYEGLSDRESARVLGCTEQTVRSQVSRALAALRRRLTEEEVDQRG